MHQGLGETYINVFLWLAAAGFAIATILVAMIRLLTRARMLWCVILTFLLGPFLAYAANSLFHHDLFVRRHQSLNKLVPQEGCLRYEPSFGHLFASYTISQEDFERWVAKHPWGLDPYDLSLVDHDSKRLNFTSPDLAYATEMAPNGGQLRVYFKDGVMYLSYNVM